MNNTPSDWILLVALCAPWFGLFIIGRALLVVIVGTIVAALGTLTGRAMRRTGLAVRPARLSLLAFFLLVTVNVAAGQVANLTQQLPKRLVADYGFWSKFQEPPYGSAQIPFQKLTHLIHA